MIDALLNPDEPRVTYAPDPDEQLDATREQSMCAPFGVRIVYRDGIERYLRASENGATEWSGTTEYSGRAARFATVDEAEAALEAARLPYDNIKGVVNLDDPEAGVEQ